MITDRRKFTTKLSLYGMSSFQFYILYITSPSKNGSQEKKQERKEKKYIQYSQNKLGSIQSNSPRLYTLYKKISPNCQRRPTSDIV